MDARRARRLLIAALILSLLLHGIIALSVRWRVTPPRGAPQRVTIARRDIIRITARVPVSPPPSPAPATPRPAAERHPVEPQKVQALAPGQRGPVRPIAARSPQPARTAAAAPCAKTDEPAAVAVEPPAPEIPVACGRCQRHDQREREARRARWRRGRRDRRELGRSVARPARADDGEVRAIHAGLASLQSRRELLRV